MNGRSALLVSLVWLAACHQRLPDHSDPAGVPPLAREELSWESFFPVPWPDPLHEKYAELFGKPYPNRARRHYELTRPFSDVKKFQIAVEELK